MWSSKLLTDFKGHASNDKPLYSTWANKCVMLFLKSHFAQHITNCYFCTLHLCIHHFLPPSHPPTHLAAFLHMMTGPSWQWSPTSTTCLLPSTTGTMHSGSVACRIQPTSHTCTKNTSPSACSCGWITSLLHGGFDEFLYKISARLPRNVWEPIRFEVCISLVINWGYWYWTGGGRGTSTSNWIGVQAFGIHKWTAEKHSGSFEWARCFVSPSTIVMLYAILPWAFDKLLNTNQTSMVGNIASFKFSGWWYGLIRLGCLSFNWNSNNTYLIMLINYVIAFLLMFNCSIMKSLDRNLYRSSPDPLFA